MIEKEVRDICDIMWQMDISNSTIQIVREALEKQIPRKPTMWGDGYADGELVMEEYECPNCGAIYEIDGETYQFCPNCGQKIAIDWSEEE